MIMNMLFAARLSSSASGSRKFPDPNKKLHSDIKD